MPDANWKKQNTIERIKQIYTEMGLEIPVGLEQIKWHDLNELLGRLEYHYRNYKLDQQLNNSLKQ